MTEAGRFIVRLRGSGSGSLTGDCAPAIYVDGMRTRQSEFATVDDLVDPSQLEGVEVYARASFAPAQYQATTDCGVILFWTRVNEEGNGWNVKRMAAGVAGFALFLALALL